MWRVSYRLDVKMSGSLFHSLPQVMTPWWRRETFAITAPRPVVSVLVYACAGAALTISLLIRPDFGHVDWKGLSLVAAGALLAERYGLDLYGDSRVSLSFVFMLAAAIGHGYAGALVVAPLMALAGHDFRQQPLYKLVFNAAMITLGGIAAAAVLAQTVGAPAEKIDSLTLASTAAAASANYIVTAGLVAVVVALTTHSSPTSVWREKFQWLLPHYLVLGLLAFITVLAYRYAGAPGLAASVAPPLLIRYGMKQYLDRTTKAVIELRRTNAELQEAHQQTQRAMEDLEEAYHETLSALVGALDVRDSEVSGHSMRVADLALAVAQEMGIRPDSQEWHDLKHGALLHDVGKIGVPDAVLRKPDALTSQEWALMRRHPILGHALLSQVRFLRGAAEISLCHHERYDGSGYPGGLAGQAIPLGARIFAVADAFDAMISNRPYRRALLEEEACEEIRRGSGTQFDPEVVEAFLRTWTRLARAGRGDLSKAA